MFEDHEEKVGKFPYLCSLLESTKVTERKVSICSQLKLVEVRGSAFRSF